MHIEQFSAWHNAPIGTKANGLDGFDTVLKFNSPLHVKHLQNLIDLQKDKTYDYAGRANASEDRFASGECAIFLTSSGYYAHRQEHRQVRLHLGADALLSRRPGRTAELDHRRRFAVGDGRQEA